MNQNLKTLIISGLKTVGNYNDCLSYIEEELTEDEFQAVESFFKWLTKKNLTIGHANFDDRARQWEVEVLQAQHGKHNGTANTAYKTEQSRFIALMDELQTKVEKHGAEQQKDKKNWGFVGDLATINETLSEALQGFDG